MFYLFTARNVCFIYGFVFFVFSRSAVQSLGERAFEKVYNYLKYARKNNISEKEVKQHLETLVSRPNDCFVVDQILYFEEELFDASSGLVKA